MRLLSRLASLALATLLAAVPAAGQGNPTGKLTGRVTSDGQPVASVTVTVSSPNLQGTRSTETSVNGDYLFPSLPPGEYTINYELAGLETVSRTARLGAAQTLPLDVEMKLAASVAEEIVVTSSLEAISQGSQSATTYTQTLIDDLPTGRGINDIVALAPGVHTTGPQKSQGQGSISVGGAVTFENLYLVNGVVINENLRGGANDLFIEGAIQETTTTTSGVSAEYGRFSGGVVNVITKSGGNAFNGSLQTGFTNQEWEEETPLTTTVTDKTIPTYELTLGGPILRDRLWFFLAGRTFDQITTTNTAAPTSVPYEVGRDEQRYEGKLTWALTPSHNVVGTFMKLDELQPGNTFPPVLDLRSVYDRETPEELRALNYTGSLTSNLFVTAQYSEREFSFIGSGSRFTDRIFGTLMLDRSRSNARYWAPTFCGVCGPELRNNENALVKASYFLSTSSLGTHDIVVGYDWYDDIRQANNHQSGSDYRIFGSSAIIQGTDIFPVLRNDGSTIIQYNPIASRSVGTHFETHSLFVNDSWRLNDKWGFNIGVRYDRNNGSDGGGAKVVDDSKISPRVALTFDPSGGEMTFHLSYATYVAAIANSQADASSVGGSPANIQWAYRGPNINTVAGSPLLTTDQALAILFAWFDANGGPNGPLPSFGVSIPGVNVRIGDDLASPSVEEIAFGGSFRLGNRGQLRADIVHREYTDFYSERRDLTTGQVFNPATGGMADLSIVENNSDLEREYDGIHTQFRFRASDRLDVGGNYSWSEAKGNNEGENRASGPIRATVDFYPEYRDPSWNEPYGYLSVDQKHRATAYGIFTVFSNDRHSLRASLLGSYGSGLAYSAIGTVRSVNYVTPNPGYVSPSPRVNYYFGGRGNLRTPDVYRADFSLNYEFRIGKFELFLQPEVVNITNEQNVDTTDVALFNQSVFTQDNTTATSCNGAPCQAFNPFTETPVQGVHWSPGPLFGQAISPLAFQTPRTYRFSVGLRF